MEGSTSISSVPQIPDDIIFDVLSRLPVKALVRFCCVCKFWQKLITSERRFVQSQLQNSVKNLTGYENIVVSWFEGDIPLDFTCKANLDSQPTKLTEHLVLASEKSAGSRLFFPELKFKLAGCCDGVICFVQFHDYKSYVNLKFKIYLCNPALRQCRALPLGHYQGKSYCWNTIVSLFFDPVVEDYKVAKIMHMDASFLVEIYSLSSDSWRLLNLSISPCGGRYLQIPVQVHNGFPCWVSKLLPHPGHLVLNVLDIPQEKIREISLPDKVQLPKLLIVQGSLYVVGYCVNDDQSEHELWLLTDDGKGSMSWAKQLVVPGILPLYLLVNRTTGITASEKHFVASPSSFYQYVQSYRGMNSTPDQHIKVYLYDWKNPTLDEHNEIRLDEGGVRCVVADYVASLVSVIPPLVEGEFSQREIHIGGEKERKKTI